MLKEKLEKATKKVLRIVERTPAASAMMAVAMGAAALSSCAYEGYKDSLGRWYEKKTVNINSVGGGNGNGWFDVNGNGGGGFWGGAPMYSGSRGWHTSGFAPGDRFLGYNRAGQGVIRVAQPLLETDAKNLVTVTDVDGNKYQVAKGTKLPKKFKVVIAEGDRTIPVPAAQYDQVTAALKKGELNFVVDANGAYGLVFKKDAEEVRSGTLTLKDLAKRAATQNVNPKANQKANQKGR